ncbi:recombinase family protein [Clostridium botulinum]|nr:recombinase family protein [Clostridium botulinum]NFN49724.1 recombinase family protein [Clostridium botulinum]
MLISAKEINKKSKHEKIKIAIYGRVSSEHESQLSAFDNQVEWYNEEVKRHPEWEVVEKYFDKGITGTQAKKRLEFLRMIEDAHKGNFNFIITREVSRFARNTLDVLKYTRELKYRGVGVYFISDGISTLDKDGETRLTNMASYAQDESRKISERVKAGQCIARLKGVLYGSGNILGYNRNGKTFDIDEEQAETVRIIFNMYLKKKSLKDIKIELLRQGRKNSQHKVAWHESTISRMLENPMYIGKQHQNKTSVTDYLTHTIKKNDKSEYILIDGKFTSIISEEDFAKVQEIKGKRVKKTANNKTYGIKTSKDKWMSLLECGCGAKFQQYKWRKNKSTGEITKGYVCRNRKNNGTSEFRINNNLPLEGVCDRKTVCDWHLELMIKDILEEIWGFRSESVKDAFQLIKENLVVDEENSSVILIRLESRIEEYKWKKNKLIELYTGDMIEKEEFRNKNEKYNEVVKNAKCEIKELKKKVSNQEEYTKNKLENIEEVLNKLVDFDVEKLDSTLIENIVDKVIVREDKQFEWFLNMSEIKSEDVFNVLPNDKIDIKRKKSIEIREKKYRIAFESVITLDRARAYKKQYNKYVRENQWIDIKFKVYVR